MSPPKRILVVDDEPRNLRLMENLLEMLGHSSESACNGEEALEKLKSGFDLVLLDLIMPGMNGFEVARRIREDSEAADIPVVMVTVLGDKETKIRAVESGANDFINKPVDKLELKVRIESLLKMKEAQDAIKRHRAELEETVVRRTAELMESEKRFRTLFEVAQDFIFIKDRDLRYTDVNEAFLEFLQMRRSDIIGKSDHALFSEDCARQAQNVESRVLQGQTIESQESVVWKSQPASLGFIRFPLRGSTGEIDGLCGIVRELADCPVPKVNPILAEDEFPSAAMRSTVASARMVAQTDSIILLTGESGTGKDYLARYIHDHSPRSRNPFYVVNCAAIPTDLAESELFGHEAGAFTGAVRRKRGHLELAEGGTLLLNEIGELNQSVQAKLLSFLDTFSFTRVGGEKQVIVNTRLIAASNMDLSREVSAGRFRNDLFFRMNVFSIPLPPLRERIEDVPVLARHLLALLSEEMRFPSPPDLGPDVLAALSEYPWPGNVRELRNVLERGLIISGGGPIKTIDPVVKKLDGSSTSAPAGLPIGRSLDEVLQETERKLIQEALRISRGKKQEAALLLGISRFSLVRHMEKLGLYEG